MRPEDVEQLRRSTVAGPLPVEQTRRLINEIVELQAERVRMRAELEELRPVVADLRRRLGQLKGHLERRDERGYCSSMPARHAVHTVPRGDEWVNVREGSTWALSKHKTKVSLMACSEARCARAARSGRCVVQVTHHQDASCASNGPAVQCRHIP